MTPGSFDRGDGKFVVKDSGQREVYDTGANRDVEDNKPRPDLVSTAFIWRLAEHMRKAIPKYGEGNWLKGISSMRMARSALRHLMQYMLGHRDEDHLAAVAFNVMCIMHYEELGPRRVLDAPFYNRIGDPGTISEMLQVTPVAVSAATLSSDESAEPNGSKSESVPITVEESLDHDLAAASGGIPVTAEEEQEWKEHEMAAAGAIPKTELSGLVICSCPSQWRGTHLTHEHVQSCRMYTPNHGAP